MEPVTLGHHALHGVFSEGDEMYVRSLLGDSPEFGRTVRGPNGHHYRSFPPTASKLAALAKLGCRHWPFRSASRVLYLGAGAGTTVSFMSDVCPGGQIIAVEFAPEPFRALLDVARGRPNVVPVLADARAPAAYAAQVGPPVDIIYQDVAQRDQWDIAHRNARALMAPSGTVVLVVKARSVDVAARPDAVYTGIRALAEAAGFRTLELIDLGPFDEGHGVLILSRQGGAHDEDGI